MNPLKNLFGNLAGSQQQPTGNNLMMMAFAAMMRGDSPQNFLQNLAKDNPMLSGIDFNNLEGSARKICKDRNVDVDKKIQELQQNLPK
jgi:hypothetical protein